jgi:hypothetical protein
MKKLLYFIAITTLIVSCEPYNEEFEGYDDNTTTLVSEIEYTLTEADYASINSSLTSYLSADYPDSVYLPIFLEDKYPTLDDGSSVTLTYSTYYGDNITYLDDINDLEIAESYELTTDDYDSMGENSGEPGKYNNFSSSVPPSEFLPDFLSLKYSAESDGFRVMLTFAYYNGSTYDSTAVYELNFDITVAYNYELTAADYDAMGTSYGEPGYFDNFSYSIPPNDYLPDFLATKYTSATSGDIAKITYAYYSSGSTSDVTAYYKFNGSAWEEFNVEKSWDFVSGIVIPEDVTTYLLDENDYDSMGETSSDPGYNDAFNAAIPPEGYLSTFLSLKFPYKKEGKRIALFYNYEASTTTIQVEEYTKTDAVGWVETGETEEHTTQFMKEDGEWNMVSAVLYTMVSEDYQYIVDYVKNNVGEEYIDSYGTAEDYYGASAYYNEFRTKDKYRETDKFATWQDAVEEAIGTVLLPYKYPDASEGMSYIITFAGYYNAMTDYTIEFECTSAGTPPGFTMTAAPTEK